MTMKVIVCLVFLFIATVARISNSQAAPGSSPSTGDGATDISATLPAKELIFSVEHSFSDGKFTPRCRLHVLMKPDGKQGIAVSDKNGFFGKDVESLKNLLAENGLYKVRIKQIIGGNITEPAVMASIPSCELQKSGFKEDFMLYFGAGGFESVMGISYSTPALNYLARECDPSKIKEGVALQTKLKVAERSPAQAIPLQVLGVRPAHLKNVKLGIEEDAQQATQGNKSFFQRYWHLIGFFMLYMVISSVMGGGGGGGEAKPEGAPPAAPAAK